MPDKISLILTELVKIVGYNYNKPHTAEEEYKWIAQSRQQIEALMLKEAEIAHILECNPITILDKTEMRLHTEGLLDKKIISCMDVAAAIFTKQKAVMNE